MNEILNSGFKLNIMPFVWAVILGIALYFSWWLIKRVLFFLIKKESIQYKLEKLFPIYERLSWIIFISLMSLNFIRINLILGLASIVLVIIISFSVIRNYIYGFLLMAAQKVTVGSRIKYQNQEGTIISFQPFFVAVETENAEIIEIPYYNLYKDGFKILGGIDNFINHKFVVKLTELENILDFKENLYKYMLNLPWILPNHLPNIEFIDSKKEYLELLINITGIDKKHCEMVEERVEEWVFNHTNH